MPAKLNPVHPGEILRVEFMEPLGLNPHKLSRALRVSAPAIYEIVNERRGISTDMALRLAHCFGTTAEFWLNMQTSYDLDVLRDKDSARIEREVLPVKEIAAD
ncbi:MAG: HigA family addiction module antitoxin [Chlamydiota bacterium]